MAVHRKVILKLLALFSAEEISLDIKKILCYRQRTHLRQIKIITVIAVCVGVAVDDDLRQILLIVILEEHLTVNRKDLLQNRLSFICKFRLVIIKHYVRVQGKCSCIGVDIYIYIILREFRLQCFNNIRLYADDLIDLGLLIRQKSCLFIQIRLLGVQSILLILKLGRKLGEKLFLFLQRC